MNKTKIDWATMSWNPVTGCRHGCPYCYARRTAHRFDAGCADPDLPADGLHVLEEKIKATPYPYGFEPAMHRYIPAEKIVNIREYDTAALEAALTGGGE